MSFLLLKDDVHAPLPVEECCCPARVEKKIANKILCKELSNATLRIPPGGLCSLELVINVLTPATHFPPHQRGRGAVIGMPATRTASMWG